MIRKLALAACALLCAPLTVLADPVSAPFGGRGVHLEDALTGGLFGTTADPFFVNFGSGVTLPVTSVDGGLVSLGSTGDTAYSGSGSASLISVEKGRYVQAAAENTYLGTSADTPWTGTGNATLSAAVKGLFAPESAISTATGTIADTPATITTTTASSASVIAQLKAIAIELKNALLFRAVDSNGNDATDTTNHAIKVNVVAGGGTGGGNAAAGATGSAVPASASYTGFSSGGNLVGVSAANPFPIYMPNLFSIANTYFGARLQDGGGNAFGTTTNPVVVGGVDDSLGNADKFLFNFTSNDLYVADRNLLNGVNNLTTAVSAPDARPVAQSVTTQDTASSTGTGMDGVSIYSGTPTTNSFAGFKIASAATVRVQVSGTWTGTLQFETAMDNAASGGTLWEATTCHEQCASFFRSIVTANGVWECSTAGATGLRVRSIAAQSGTASVQATFTPNPSPRNTAPGRLVDNGANPLLLASGSAPISVATASAAQVVALVASKAIYVTSFDLMAGGTTNVTLEYGTGTACGTGTTVLTGAYPLTAQSGVSKGSGAGAVLFVPAGNALCALSSSAVQVSGSVSYAQF